MLRYIGWIILLLGASFMLYSLEYFFDFYHWNNEYLAEKQLVFSDLWLRKDIDFWLAKRNKVHDIAWTTALYLHIVGSLLAIMTGVFQLLKEVRNYSLKLHRNLGKIYVISILALGVPTGGYMSIYANGGIWACIGFSILTFLWAFTTWKGYDFAKRKRIFQHQRWMIRSYAITFAAVMLRIWTEVLSNFNIDIDTITTVCAWLSWIPNVLFAEIWMRSNKSKS